jgi:hypothetical protein
MSPSHCTYRTKLHRVQAECAKYGHSYRSISFLLLPTVFQDGIHIGCSKQNQNFPLLTFLHSWQQCATALGTDLAGSITPHGPLQERHYKNTKLNYMRYFQGDKLYPRWQHGSVKPTAARKCQHLYSLGNYLHSHDPQYLISLMGQLWGNGANTLSELCVEYPPPPGQLAINHEISLVLRKEHFVEFIQLLNNPSCQKPMWRKA